MKKIVSIFLVAAQAAITGSAQSSCYGLLCFSGSRRRSHQVCERGRKGNTATWDLCAGIISLVRWVGKGKGLTTNMDPKEEPG